MSEPLCIIPSCTNPQRYRLKGLCDAHYQRRRLGMDMDRPIQQRRRRKEIPRCQCCGQPLPRTSSEGEA